MEKGGGFLRLCSHLSWSLVYPFSVFEALFRSFMSQFWAKLWKRMEENFSLPSSKTLINTGNARDFMEVEEKLQLFYRDDACWCLQSLITPPSMSDRDAFRGLY